MVHADDGSLLENAVRGAIAGAVATVPMTWVMEVLHRRLPPQEQYPLPPRQATMRLVQEAGLSRHLDEPKRLGVTLLAHFGMGTAAGVFYGLVGRRLPLPPALAGATCGLAVWAGNYLGLLPAADLLSPATRHPPRRNALMIAAHLVWGATTSVLVEYARQPRGAALLSRNEAAQAGP